MNNKPTIKILLAVIAFALLFLSGGFKGSFNNNFQNIFYKVKGEAQPDTGIIIVHITSADIENIGPWPVKRNYYALLINTLAQYEVKKIGLEVFLSSRFVTQSLYDNLLTNQIEQAGNVVLSSVAGSIIEQSDKYYTDSLSYPSPKILNEDIATGHINFVGEKTIPLTIAASDRVEKAFSYSLLGEENINEHAIKVNFISSWKKFKSFTFTEFFRLVQNNDDQLYQLNNKIIIIGVSDIEAASMFSSAFDNEIPGAAFHAFALDNLIHSRWMRTDLENLSSFVFLLMLIGMIFYMHSSKRYGRNKIRPYIFFTAGFIVLSFLLFSFFYLQLDYASFVLPLAVLIVCDIIFLFIEKNLLYKGAVDEREILHKHLKRKEEELTELQSELNAARPESAAALKEKIKSLHENIEKLKAKEMDELPATGSTAGVNNFYGMIYRSRSMNKIVDVIKKAAPEDAAVLILGESGTGKELAANAIHRLSKRSGNNFVAVNCGALPDSLLESELFGHVKGAFTGAGSDKKGRFEAADEGTIFLDEIGETSENFQVKLLRVLQSGSFEKVGSSKTEKVDVRLIAATNKNIEREVRNKNFREDLYYRLNVIVIELPPLRERREDIEAIANYFIQKDSPQLKLSKGVLDVLNNYEWKGNVRELESVIKRASIFTKAAGGEIIQLSTLPENIVKGASYNFEDLVIESLREKKFSHSSITETAKELGDVSRTLISENFRGYAFKVFADASFNKEEAVKIISAFVDKEVNDKVGSKLQTFLSNIYNSIERLALRDFNSVKENLSSKYKNLPQKFHIYLDEIIKNYLDKEKV